MGKYDIRAKTPKYSGSEDSLEFIWMEEQGITNYKDKHPVLGTLGLGPCISVVGYDSVKKIGFLTHYTVFTDVYNSFNILMNSLPKNEDYSFDISIIGGNDFSTELYMNILISIFEKYSNIELELREEDVLGLDNVRSVVLDTRNGEKYLFNSIIEHLNFPKLKMNTQAILKYFSI